MTKALTGKKYRLAGMTLEVIADEGEQWKIRNTTTGETIYMKKSVLDKAIRFGQAEEVG